MLRAIRSFLTCSGVVAMTMAAGCAMPMTAGSHVDHDQNFKQYRTFDWGPADALPTGDARLDRNPFFEDYMRGAVGSQLSSKGLELFTPGTGTPDLLIHYHATISERMDVNSVDRERGYCQSDCPGEIVWYEAGTLVLDVMDARTSKLVWRSWAQGRAEHLLRDRDEMARTIQQAVAVMLERFPAAR
jgi:hypothetical protein